MAIDNSIYIQWDQIDGAVTYNVYRSIDDGVTYNILATGITDTFYSDPAGTIDYWYKISSVDVDLVESDLSDPIQGYDQADICIIRGSIVDLNGDPSDELIEATYYVSTEDLPRFAQDNLISRRDMVAIPDERGIFEIPMVKLSLATLVIKGCGYQCKFQVPDLDLVELSDLAAIGVIEKPTDYQF